MRDAIASLEGRTREVAWLTWVEGMSRPEIAAATGIGVKRVERYRQAARRQLEVILGGGVAAGRGRRCSLG